MHDLYIDNNFVSFEQLVSKYDVPRSHFFSYLQVRSFVASQIAGFPHCFPVSPLHTIFKLKLEFRQIIRRTYKLLNIHNPTPLDGLKNRWEEDLGEQIPEDIWHKIIQRTHSSSICQHIIQYNTI